MLRYGLAYVEEHSKDGTIQLQKHVMRYPQFLQQKAIEGCNWKRSEERCHLAYTRIWKNCLVLFLISGTLQIISQNKESFLSFIL